jgi:hypothetical protein
MSRMEVNGGVLRSQAEGILDCRCACFRSAIACQGASVAMM